MSKIIVALAGNPNVGKTTLFNAITGARQHVGNWPGVTVEKKIGSKNYKGHEVSVIDLPGTYSLSAYTLDEIVARDYIIKGRPDVVVHIADATNLERNLYLTLQLLELDVNVILALNMYDIVKDRGDQIDIDRIGTALQVPVIETVARKGEGVEEILDQALELSGKGKSTRSKIKYGRDVERKLDQLQDIIKKDSKIADRYPSRWLSIKLLEDDKEAFNSLHGSEIEYEVRDFLSSLDKNYEMIMVQKRYDYVKCLLSETCILREEEIDQTDMLDKVLTNKYLGIPIFLTMMWAAFELTFKVAEPFMNLIDMLFTNLIQFTTNNIGNEKLASLIGDGILGGVGSVLVFVPNIFILFLIISLLEDSGYLARAAFIMDKFMSKLGLHGKSFIPLLIGFGCSVPAIMACRTIEDPKDRLITILSTPFITCGARLPVYILLAGAFFVGREGTIVFSMYLLSILLAILSAFLLRNVFFHGEKSPFIMELPPYRVPTIKTALIHTWERGSMYLKKAGTVIFLGVIIIWFLASFPFGVEYGSEQSVIGMMGKVLEPIVRPLGFDWKIAVALVLGFVAKEIVVGSLGTLYGTGENDQLLTEQLRADPNVTALSSFGLMLFTLIYIPCIATVAIIWKETGSWRWTLFSVLYSISLAWVITFIVYNVGLALGF